MDKPVSRSKYEAMKEKAEQWREYATDYQDRNERMSRELDALVVENESLQNKIIPSVDNTPLENENCELRKSLRILRKKLSSIEEKSAKDQFVIERKLLLKEAEVERLQSALTDNREQLKEMKGEYKEFRRELRDSSRSQKNEV